MSIPTNQCDETKDVLRRTRDCLDQIRAELLKEREPQGHWTGCLSDSALSTATAISALASLRLRGRVIDGADDVIRRGLAYLNDCQHKDGGFGDTDRSHSNIATSYLVIAAQQIATDAGFGDESWSDDAKHRCQSFIDRSGGITGLRRRYGKDKTFVVPILTNLAIAGLVPWSEVPPLPFEAAVVPQSWYRFLGMPVVSYAIPALVAIGQVRFLVGGPCWWPYRWLRRRTIEPSMRVLDRMQPVSGGYLEATPLTAFVVMALATSERQRHPVTDRGIEFLLRSQTVSGGWPIDTNLATWVTSLASLALSSDPSDDGIWSSKELIHWQLDCQHRVRHPFTGAEPGGWGWTDLSGAVPDADDTPGAVLALLAQRRHHPSHGDRIDQSCRAGIQWLLKLQNRDGGWPTFCRGWGKLPFDRSSVDLTAHAMRALSAWNDLDGPHADVASAIRRGQAFLRQQQASDGSWSPLWFGNQDRESEDNPIYGTGRVLVDVDESLGINTIVRGLRYLIQSQNRDGGWGGGPSVMEAFSAGNPGDRRLEGSTVEETAIAVEALADWCQRIDSIALKVRDSLRASLMAATLSGVEWLMDAVNQGRHRIAWPIGFYFAKLWYYERLYPLIFTTAALARVDRCLRSSAAA
ncbi:MAG: prenyltransferase/squalene oxidase repeat-containing protein [Planctomycetota bacterium]